MCPGLFGHLNLKKPLKNLKTFSKKPRFFPALVGLETKPGLIFFTSPYLTFRVGICYAAHCPALRSNLFVPIRSPDVPIGYRNLFAVLG